LKTVWVITSVACSLLMLPISVHSSGSDPSRQLGRIGTCRVVRSRASSGGARRDAIVLASRSASAAGWVAGSSGARVARRAPTSPGGDGAQGCASCESWSICLDGLGDAGASTQVVPLKNGVMYVYTADTQAGIRAVQSAVAHHQERLRALGPAARLCPECRALHAAYVHGKLTHEVLNIEGGCIMITTSSDPAVITRILMDAGIPGSPRVKG